MPALLSAICTVGVLIHSFISLRAITHANTVCTGVCFHSKTHGDICMDAGDMLMTKNGTAEACVSKVAAIDLYSADTTKNVSMLRPELALTMSAGELQLQM